jgi:hypothetical protein
VITGVFEGVMGVFVQVLVGISMVGTGLVFVGPTTVVARIGLRVSVGVLVANT